MSKDQDFPYWGIGKILPLAENGNPPESQKLANIPTRKISPALDSPK